MADLIAYHVPDAGAVREQLQRILESKRFAASASLGRFFRFIVEETLEGRADSLKEYTLGVEVFDRGDAFDPRIDPIVRVQARNLRLKLDRYYEEDGADAPLLITLPKGCYVPAFEVRMPREANSVARPALQAVPAPRPHRTIPLWMPAAAACLLVLVGGGLWLRGDRRPVAAVQPARESEAQSLYTRGRYMLDRHRGETLHKSADCFRRAVRLEPRFAAAWAGLADAYDVMSQFGVMAPAEGMPEARRAAQRALELDPALAEAHVALAAVIEAYDWNWKAAEREYRRALELNPGLPAAHLWYGMFLRDQGRLKEAVPELERASRLDPLSVMAALSLSHAYSLRGDRVAAARVAAVGLELEPHEVKPRLAVARLVCQGPAATLAMLGQARDDASGDPPSLAALAGAYAANGYRAEAVELLDEIHRLAAERYVSPIDIARVYMALDDPDGAVPFLEAAYEERSSGVIFLPQSRFASQPRVRAIIARLHLNG